MILNIPAFWMYSLNFGDALTPWLIKKISGYNAIWTNHSIAQKYMVTGSILNDPIAQTCIVWGSGIAYRDSHILKPLEIRAVRGPRTREAVIKSGLKCPEIYGDPALLMPRFYSIDRTCVPKYKLGIIPHIIDYDSVLDRYQGDSGVVIINLNETPESVIDQIQQCEVFISSSLHGIIISHAYEKPCGWVKFSEKILGDNTKFYDYFESVGKFNEPGPFNLQENNPSINEIIDWIPKNVELKIDLDKLYEVCPFKPII